MKAEPVMVGTFVAAVISAIVLIVFKQELSAEEKAAIVGAVILGFGLFQRSKVTPV